MPVAGHVTAVALQSNEPLRRSQEELDYLVRALSHDMNAQFMLLENSFSHLAKAVDDPGDPHLHELVSHVRSCLEQSQRFLGDLVGLARTGRLDMEPSRVELVEMVEEVLFEHHGLLADRQVAILVRAPLPAVWCNRRRLEQIISNLLQNAVKHGCDPRNPRIEFSAAESPGTAGQNLVALRIYDNGPGIPREFHEEIFLPGRRLPQAAPDGSGMGLAIVRRIVEHYGGSVSVDPDCASGAAILVRLPAAAVESPLRAGPSEPAAIAEFPGRSLGHDSAHEDQRLQPHQPLRERRGLRGRA